MSTWLPQLVLCVVGNQLLVAPLAAAMAQALPGILLTLAAWALAVLVVAAGLIASVRVVVRRRRTGRPAAVAS